MQTPETATPRDIYTILFGSIDLATRAKMNRYYYSENGVDLESVKDPLNFNPRYYGKSRLEAQQEGYLDAASQFNEPEPDFRISYEDLFTWQREVVDTLRHREDPRFGRSVHWLWEEKGAVGKSILAAYLVDCCGAIEVAGTSNDALHAITMYCQTHGEGPKVIVFDVPRSHSGIDYETIEKAKDGKYFSGKYNATSVRYSRPHVIVFANEKPNMSKLSADRYKTRHLVDLDMTRPVAPTPAAVVDAADQGAGVADILTPAGIRMLDPSTFGAGAAGAAAWGGSDSDMEE
jgi:hypothetical protein